VAESLIRVVSDVHFADRASRVRALGELRPLLEGADSFVFNGDTLDTRKGPDDSRTQSRRAEVLEFFAGAAPRVTFLTGNHDPDLSGTHLLDAANGRVLVTHGDVLFDTIVPWSSESRWIRGRVIAALASLPGDGAERLEGRLQAFRSVAASIPQRHQSERNPIKYVVRLAGDTVWPPTRVLTILQAWRDAPAKAASLAARHRPRARVVVIGHVHRPGVARTPSGTVVVNTGSFCRPFGAVAADITADAVRVRRVAQSRGAFRLGPVLEEIGLS
jgi:UDP-2,3-diacylglucosamine pyrophosphatase LpxH